jgi:acetate kinase
MHVERVLVLNAGSSSLKWSLLSAQTEDVLAGADIPYTAAVGGDRGALVRRALEQAGDVPAVGFRVVHGGTLSVRPFASTVRCCRACPRLTSSRPCTTRLPWSL